MISLCCVKECTEHISANTFVEMDCATGIHLTRSGIFIYGSDRGLARHTCVCTVSERLLTGTHFFRLCWLVNGYGRLCPGGCRPRPGTWHSCRACQDRYARASGGRPPGSHPLWTDRVYCVTNHFFVGCRWSSRHFCASQAYLGYGPRIVPQTRLVST